MKLKEIMTPAPASITTQDTVADAAQRMKSLDVGFLPVAENGTPVGVITDRDITVRAVAEGRDPQQTTAREVMTGSIEILSEDQAIEDAVRLMQDKRIRRVLIKNDGGEISGVVSLGDLAVKLGDKGLYADALEEISRPAHPNRS